jgi:hypothetical protein
MLLRFGQRAPIYDRENRFFQEDFDELRAADYLKLAVPQDRRWRQVHRPGAHWGSTAGYCRYRPRPRFA